MKTESQKEMILQDLLCGIKMTPLDAIKWYGCTKLSTRVGELERDKGIPIERELIEVKTRQGKTRVMSYWIENPKRLK